MSAMSVRVKEKIPMEEKSDDGKRKKPAPSIPVNYISILQLQERWINDKEWKQKEEEEELERRRKQQVEEQQRVEEDLKKAEARGKRENIDERKRLDRSNRKNQGRISRKKESTDGGEAKFADKGEPEVTAAVRSVRGEDATVGLRGFRRKRYDSRKNKKKNQDVTAKEDIVECGSAAPPEIIVTENNTPVKNANRVYRKKVEKATGKKSIGSRDVKLSIKEGETKTLKAETKSSNHNRRNQRHNLHPQCVAVDEDVVECGSIAPLEYIGTENHTPVKDVIRVYRKKGKKSVESREKAVTDYATAIETKFKNLSIKEGETKNLKAQTRSFNRNRLNERHDFPSQRDRMQIETGSMVWVKKEQNERADYGTGSGVKPLNP